MLLRLSIGSKDGDENGEADGDAYTDVVPFMRSNYVAVYVFMLLQASSLVAFGIVLSFLFTSRRVAASLSLTYYLSFNIVGSLGGGVLPPGAVALLGPFLPSLLVRHGYELATLDENNRIGWDLHTIWYTPHDGMLPLSVIYILLALSVYLYLELAHHLMKIRFGGTMKTQSIVDSLLHICRCSFCLSTGLSLNDPPRTRREKLVPPAMRQKKPVIVSGRDNGGVHVYVNDDDNVKIVVNSNNDSEEARSMHIYVRQQDLHVDVVELTPTLHPRTVVRTPRMGQSEFSGTITDGPAPVGPSQGLSALAALSRPGSVLSHVPQSALFTQKDWVRFSKEFNSRFGVTDKLSEDVIDTKDHLHHHIEPIPDSVLEGSPVLVIDHVTKIYPAGVSGIVDVNVKLIEGELSVVLAHNGAGKSTLFGCISSSLEPTYGSIYLDDLQGVGLVKRRSRINIHDVPIGICINEKTLQDHLTVVEHLQLYAAVKGVAVTEVNTEVANMLSTLSMDTLATNKVKDLNLSQRRRLRLGLAFIGPSRIILLDEITNGLDVCCL